MPTARPTPRTSVATILVALVALLLVPLLAAVNALVGPMAVLPYAALAVVFALLLLPLELVVLGGFVLAAAVAGLVDYFGHVSQVFWLPYLMGALFALRAVGERLRPKSAADVFEARRAQRHPPSPAIVLAVLYLLVAACGTLLALPPLPQVIVAAKNYVFLWGLFLLLLWSTWTVTYSERMWTALIVIACLQLPVTLVQRFYFAAKRSDAASWDAIVGTLGGNPESGGHTAAMALLCCTAIAVLLVRMRDRRLGPFIGWLGVLVCAAPIAVAEVKAGFIWLTLVFLFMFARTLLREPVRAIGTLVVGAALVAGIGWIYKTTLYDRSGSMTLSQIYEKQIRYALDPHEYRSDLHRLGRLASLVYWWDHNKISEQPLQTAMGSGLGASRSSSSFGVGELARRMRIPVDITGLSTLLWDVGLLGAACFTGFLVVSAVSGYRVSKRDGLPAAWRESATVSSVVLAMIALGLLYNRDAIDHPAVQMLMFFAVANVILARRAMGVQAAARAVPAGPASLIPPAKPATP